MNFILTHPWLGFVIPILVLLLVIVYFILTSETTVDRLRFCNNCGRPMTLYEIELIGDECSECDEVCELLIEGHKRDARIREIAEGVLLADGGYNPVHSPDCHCSLCQQG